jgi:hypothetical protein
MVASAGFRHSPEHSRISGIDQASHLLSIIIYHCNILHTSPLTHQQHDIYSYRDPNLLGTLTNYDGSPNHLKHTALSDEALEQVRTSLPQPPLF